AERAEVLAAQALHDDVRHPRVPAGLDELREVLALERGDDARLALEATDVRLPAHLEDLDRHVAPGAAITRRENDPHTASTEHPLDRVVSHHDGAGNGKRHPSTWSHHALF